MTSDLFKGMSFWRKDPYSGKEHLYFVISDVCEIDGNVLAVNMTTFYKLDGSDLSCVLDVGEHPAIKRKSYIAYSRATVFKGVKIIQSIFNKEMRKDIFIGQELLRKIQLGAKKSDLLSDELKQYFKYF